MTKSTYNSTLTLFLSLFIISGCATPLPSTYNVTGNAGVIDGPILALAGDGNLVAAVNSDGLFIKSADGPWVNQEVPGIRRFSRVTCLAVDGGTIYLGTEGEGLHILSEGTWEVKTSRYGGFPDDDVLSIAIDGVDEGLPGKTVWVGTGKGISAFKDGSWTIYKPESDWLVAMIGKTGSGSGKVFVARGFKLGAKGDDSSKFKPPVSAISVGPDQIVFGNRNSGLAIVNEHSVAIFKLGGEHKFSHLEMDGGVIWAGTDAGLLWGGLRGHAEGKPWPTNRSYLQWSGTLFGSRDTRVFEYRWKLVGYNTAKIVGLEKRGSDVWVAHRAIGNGRHAIDRKRFSNEETELMTTDPITDIRRYVNIDEYIARKQTAKHESYGSASNIRGEPSALFVTPDNSKVWIGTTQGLWELEQ